MIIRTRTLLAATRLHEYPPTDIGVRAELEAGNLAPTQLSAGAGESANKTPCTLARCHLRPPGRRGRHKFRQNPLHPRTVALPTGPAGAADANFANTPCTLPRCHFRPAQPTQAPPKPLTPSHGATSDRLADTADANFAKTPCTLPRCHFRPAQPTQAPPKPLTPWHGGASDRPGRHSRRMLRQHPLHRGTVALPTGPAGTADARSANTPCTVARWRFRPARPAQPTHAPPTPLAPWRRWRSRRHGSTSRVNRAASTPKPRSAPRGPGPRAPVRSGPRGPHAPWHGMAHRGAIPPGRFAAPPPTTWRHTSWRRRSRARLAGQS